MRRVFTALVAVLGIALLAPEAASQCTMSQRVMDGGYLLCAVGGSEWDWTGPDGFTAATICVNVTTPGTYTVRVFDGFNGLWSAPCSFTFSSIPTSPQCAISGPDSVCTGATVAWCAPTGNFSYDWTGPDGFTASTACVDLGAAGDYWLTLTDLATGAGSDPCTRTLSAGQCIVPHTGGVCPSSARWWGRSCERLGARLDAATFAHVAAMVDDKSSVWSYGGTADGFCALLRHRQDMNDAATAKRHYAAVLANLSAAEIGVTATDGHAVGLDASASLAGMRGMPDNSTVGDWVAATESQLMSLAGSSWHNRSAREEFRRIARQARAINRMPGSCAQNLTAAIDDDDDDLELSGSVMAAAASISVSSTPRRDPLSGATHMSFTLLRSESVELTVIDIAGRRVRHLASGVYSAGVHDFAWDGHDDDGRSVRAGAYFVAGRVGDERLSQRLFILR
jgi:hypothetical protein